MNPLAIPFRRAIPVLLFLTLVTLVSLHLYHHPGYDIDMLGYMANVAALENSTAPEIHAAVYGDLASADVPEGTRAHLLGLDQQGTPGQIASLRDRAQNPYHFAEFLPCFAIRPLYIELLHIFRKFGVGLVKATVLGSILPYIALSLLTFLWSSRYVGQFHACWLCSLLVISPTTLRLAHHHGPDSLSVFWACLSLYSLFERRHTAVGLVLLLSSIYVRTDNVLLCLTVIFYLCCVSKGVDRIKGAVLALLSVSSVLLINHFAGDYGWRMLYYRGFIGAPLAPGEFVAHFSLADYAHALRIGVVEVFNGYCLPFVLLGTVGFLLLCPEHPFRRLFLITVVFTAMHFVIFPLADDRYFGLFYIIMSLTAISAIARTRSTFLARLPMGS